MTVCLPFHSLLPSNYDLICSFPDWEDACRPLNLLTGGSSQWARARINRWSGHPLAPSLDHSRHVPFLSSLTSRGWLFLHISCRQMHSLLPPIIQTNTSIWCISSFSLFQNCFNFISSLTPRSPENDIKLITTLPTLPPSVQAPTPSHPPSATHMRLHPPLGVRLGGPVPSQNPTLSNL